jgi:ABC-type multidrug transport system fused ATPase/permease subunit
MVYSIYKILPKKIRLGSFFIILLIILGTVVEILGIGMILPILNSLIQENYLENKYINELSIFFNNPNKIDFIKYCVLSLMLVYFSKTLLLIFINFKISKLNKVMLEYLTTSLFNSYILKPYVFHINSNSSFLTKNILSESNNLTFIIIALINIFSELMLLFFVIILIFIYDPILTFCILLFITIIFLFIIYISKKKLLSIGRKRQKFDTMRFKILQKSFGASIKLIKIFGLEKKYSDEYADTASKYASITTLQIFLQSLPKVFFELLFITLISLLVLLLIYLNYSLSNILVTLGFFGIIFFRLTPSFVKLIGNFNTIRFATEGYKIIYKELDNYNYTKLFNKNVEILKFNSYLQLNNISYKFERDKKTLFKKLNFKIQKGELVGVIGPSGSGKTTLINLICGLLDLQSGSIIVDGVEVKNNIKSWQKNIGFVPQQVYLDDDTIKKNIALGVPEEKIDTNKVLKSLRDSKLLEFVDKQKDGIETKVGELGSLVSGGQLQRLGIARALYRNPNLLILDESTSNLDLKTEDQIIDTVNELKKNKLTVIIVSHRESTLRLCDQKINL